MACRSAGTVGASFNNIISYTDAIAVSDFFHTNLEQNGFTNSGTVYINLDAFWNNLNGFQLQSFVNHCHALGQKAGIYFGPFVWFGSTNAATNYLCRRVNQYLPLQRSFAARLQWKCRIR